MDFGFLPPPPSLAHIVKTVWFARGTRAEFDRADPIVPDGCIELVFNLADPFEHVDETGARRRQPADLLVGPSLRPTIAIPTGEVDLLGLRFRPGCTSAFLRTPMSMLTDQLIAISSVISGADRVLEEMLEQPRERRLAHLSAAFAGRARAANPRSSPAAVRLSLDAIERHRGTVSIETLSVLTGVSRRHVERQFRDEVGLGAKHVARIARVHHALELITTHPSFTGADIAAHCGYSDQAHLVRECRELTGATPSRLTATETTLATLMRHPTDSNHAHS
jgi:AraC-like DNA-binding protein